MRHLIRLNKAEKIRALFYYKLGRDTIELAEKFKCPEAEIYNLIARATRFKPLPHENNLHRVFDIVI